jgi:hypothetical protein
MMHGMASLGGGMGTELGGEFMGGEFTDENWSALTHPWNFQGMLCNPES